MPKVAGRIYNDAIWEMAVRLTSIQSCLPGVTRSYASRKDSVIHLYGVILLKLTAEFQRVGVTFDERNFSESKLVPPPNKVVFIDIVLHEEN